MWRGSSSSAAVPVRISYDNTTIAVSKVMGKERALTRGFLTLESHHLFDHHFCRVGRGNEKGHVENHVGYSRRNLLVPVPSFPSWAALNGYLGRCVLCRPVPTGPGQGRHQGRTARGRPCRHVGFAGRGLRAPAARPRSRQLALPRAFRPQRLLGADAHAHHEVSVIGGIEEVAITQRDRGGRPPRSPLGQRAHHL